MTRQEIIAVFRTENPEITDRVITDALLYEWCKEADKQICAVTRCITDDGTTFTTTANDTNVNLSDITKFYDIDEYPGGGVTYNKKRLEKTTMAALDREDSNWRSRSAGTPRKYYRRADKIYFDRPIGSGAEDVVVYSVLISDDFYNDGITPFNQLKYLEPFHYGIVKYLQWKVKEKIGKGQEASQAATLLSNFLKSMVKMLGGGKFATISFQPPDNMSGSSGMPR